MTLSLVGSVTTVSGSTSPVVTFSAIGNLVVVATDGGIVGSPSGVALWTRVNYGNSNLYGGGSLIETAIYIGTITATGSFTIPAVGINGTAVAEFSSSLNSGGYWANPDFPSNYGPPPNNPSSVQMFYNTLTPTFYSSGDYNTNAYYPQSPGIQVLNSSWAGYVDNLFVASAVFSAGGASGSTAGFTYVNYGTLNRCQFIYKLNLSSTAYYMPSWSATTSATMATCANTLAYEPYYGASVMVV